MNDRQLPLVEGITIWRQVLHLPHECIFDPTVTPAPGPRGASFLRVNFSPDFLFEPELRGGIFRGVVAFVDKDLPAGWTHGTVTKVTSSAVEIKIEPILANYLGWRLVIRNKILQARRGALSKDAQIKLMRDTPTPDELRRQRLWCTWSDSQPVLA